MIRKLLRWLKASGDERITFLANELLAAVAAQGYVVKGALFMFIHENELKVEGKGWEVVGELEVGK
jgi:hypothetical protein